MFMRGDRIKAVFWEGERIWAEVDWVDEGVIHALVLNEPYIGSHYKGEPVTCTCRDVLDMEYKTVISGE